MQFTWDERKRLSNLKAHGLDFVDAELIFLGHTYTLEDDRMAYGEQRFLTLGYLSEDPVSLAHTEDDYEIRCISFRKATKREIKLLESSLEN